MKLSNSSSVPVYTISGSSTARPLPEWLIRKRKRSLKKDPEFTNRIELLQDFEFEEESCCVRVSEDGDWIVSTGTYKPQIHVHYLPHLALSFARHTTSLNQTFRLLSSDYSKSLHLQSDRLVELHTPQGCHYETRIPRYGRDLIYDRSSAEALVPSVGVNENGLGEVFRLNLEIGRFMKGYEVDVGGDDFESVGGGALQGGINTGAVNTAAFAERSHNLLAFGTSIGTVEFWDSRSRSRVGVLHQPSTAISLYEARSEVTALEFHPSGLNLAVGSSTGLIHLYDLRSPVPTLKKDQGYGYPIHSLIFLESSSTTRNSYMSSEPKILSADKRIIKIWNSRTGSPWTSMEPAVDLHNVAWCQDSGMLLTSNQGRQQHTFFIPQLGPAPKWCSFLDNVVEEMAEDFNNPHNSFANHRAGEVYDNYKFIAMPELKALNLDHLIGTTSLLRPYMHGFFVAQNLYEEARLISQPELWEERRQKSIQEKIDKERESRIRGSKKANVKINRKIAERILEREEKNERRKAKRAIEKGLANVAQSPVSTAQTSENPMSEEQANQIKPGGTLLTDPRFAELFKDADFAVDEESYEFKALNPVSADPSKRLTAVEAEELADLPGQSSSISDDDDSDDDDASSSDDERSRARQRQRQSRRTANHNDDENNKESEFLKNRISTPNYRKTSRSSKPMLKDKQQQQQQQQQRREHVNMRVSSSSVKPEQQKQQRLMGNNRSFGARASYLKASEGKDGNAKMNGERRRKEEVGEKRVTFDPSKERRKQVDGDNTVKDGQHAQRSYRDRRSASGNTFRRM